MKPTESWELLTKLRKEKTLPTEKLKEVYV
jgi:hypothetical protein